MSTITTENQERRAHGYSTLQIGLHWAIVGLIILNWQLADGLRDFMGPNAATGTPSHVIVGLVILALMLGRLVLRLFRPVAPLGQSHGMWHRASVVTHWLLYALLLALPLSGIASWFGGIGAAGDIHETLWTALVVLSFLHAGAALFHQFILRDSLMRRMFRPV